MKSRTESESDAAAGRMDELLDRARQRAWEGPDRSPRVEEFLRGIVMQTRSKFTLTRTALILIGVGALAGGSLAAAVTHTILNHRATIITDDGAQYDVELLETADGASGTFVTDDGSVYDIDMVESDGQKEVTVNIDSTTGGASTVILEDGSAPSVLTAPGQPATITITESAEDDDGE